jgi:two-component system, NtrC family, sensor kinase
VKHLTTRLAVLLMLALMLITGAHDYVRLVRERERLEEVTETDQRIFAETLAVAVRHNVRRGRTTEELQELLDDIRERPRLIWVAIFNPRGDVVAASIVSGDAAPTYDTVIEVALRTGEPISSSSGTGHHRVLRYVRPFRWPGGGKGALEVRQSLGQAHQEFARALREGAVLRLVVLTLFVLSIVAITRWSIARPIRALIDGARAVGGGNLAQRIHLRRDDELKALADEFNRMAENLEQAHQAVVAQSEERLRLEREVQQAQKLAAVGLLAAEVAHEIGTPLGVIAGRTEALERVIPSGQAERRHLDVILRQTDRIAEIVRSLLDYTRPRRPDLREESLAPVLARVANLLGSRYRAKPVRMLLDLPADLPRIVADAEQLQQLFINLFANALDASPVGAAVRVTVGPEPLLPADGRAEIVRGKAEAPTLDVHIVDEGPGMTAEDLSHVFEPFFSTKTRVQGTGLGLPIVEEIVRAHRGEVAMLSVSGRGTEVIVRLPLAAADDTREDAAPEDTGGTR